MPSGAACRTSNERRTCFLNRCGPPLPPSGLSAAQSGDDRLGSSAAIGRCSCGHPYALFGYAGCTDSRWRC